MIKEDRHRSFFKKRKGEKKAKREHEMPLLLLLSPPTAAAAGPAPAPAPAPVAVSLPPPSRLRASHLLFAFPRLRKYGRRDREPVATSLGELEEEDEDDEEEEEEEEEDDEEVEVEVEVDEDEFLKNRPKPVGFGAGKTYSTDIEEQLLREMGLGGRRRSSGSGPTPAKNRAAANSAKGTGEDLNDGGVCVRVWNLPKKKNIHKDLNLAFKGFPGLVNIEPAVSANKKTRDPICKGFAYLKLESVEAATRFVELYSQKAVSFGKVQKPIRCCVVDSQSSVDSQNQHPVVRQSVNPG
ncbi:LOW QUALITY PROTEIN: uncharacterized protein [Oryza sativa Japonica Group]|uniref:LOW QUALITY PROTEIN: uncharacterized protein n=1 Tax=Oryza sativa subsp. japonica TaxID=39947 RepID=UPI0007754BF6|nr:LOW QUALITY PROTEIN: nucleoplasmin-2-like [Oryza sativa Japonica Group]